MPLSMNLDHLRRCPALRKPGAQEVHLWSLELPAEGELQDFSRRVLSEDELDRAGRFHFEVDRRRFIMAHAFLRTILAAYQGRGPQDIRIAADPKGKPHLLSGGLEFNLTHSGDRVMLACTASEPVGVDVEKIREMPDMDQIVRHYFSPAEIAAWTDLPWTTRERAFFTCWTRKEAYVKAIGDGLAAPLKDFDVTIHPDAPAEISFTGNPGQPPWSLFDVSPDHAYAAAIAIRGTGWAVVRHDIEV